MQVIGIGDNVVDQYIQEGIMYPGGNALNFSVYAKRMGADAAYAGVFGNDRAGLHIHHVMNSLGIDIRFSRIENGENGISVIRLNDGDRSIEDVNEGGVLKKYPIILDDELLRHIQNFSLVHTSIYAGLEEKLYMIKNLKVPLSFDFSDLWDYDYLKTVSPHIDFALFSCSEMQKPEMETLIQCVMDYGCKLFIGTLGKTGVLVMDGKRRFIKKPYQLRDPVIDTLGAGDAFVTGFLLSYIQGLTQFNSINKHTKTTINETDHKDFEYSLIEYSMSVGNMMAAYVCQDHGAFGYGIPINCFEEVKCP